MACKQCVEVSKNQSAQTTYVTSADGAEIFLHACDTHGHLLLRAIEAAFKFNTSNDIRWIRETLLSIKQVLAPKQETRTRATPRAVYNTGGMPRMPQIVLEVDWVTAQTVEGAIRENKLVTFGRMAVD